MSDPTTSRIPGLASPRRAGLVVLAAFALLVSTWLSPIGAALGLDGGDDPVDFPTVDAGEVIEVTEPGTVLDGLILAGSIIIKADDVTIKNSIVASSGPAPIRVAAGLTDVVIRDSHLRCLENDSGLFAMRAGIMGDNYTAVNVNVSDCAWAFLSGTGTTILGAESSQQSILDVAPDAEDDQLDDSSEALAGEIHYSSAADRSNPTSLAAATVSDSIAVFFVVDGPSNIDHVEWFLDGQLVRDDDLDPPYDMLPGPTVSGLLDTTGLIDGIHMITAVAVTAAGPQEFVAGFLVDNTGSADQPFELEPEPEVDPVPDPTPAPTVEAAPSSSLVAWSDIDVGRRRLPTITIDDSIYPETGANGDEVGVQFYLNGSVDERSSARPNGWDATGPQEQSTFHLYPRITLAAGDVIMAKWMDRNGDEHQNEIVVGGEAARVQSSEPPTAEVEEVAPVPPSEPSTAVQPGTEVPATDDGLNPVYNGTRGIVPSSPHPIPTGFPTPSTTGVPDGVTLTPSGSLVITEPGAVIDGLDIAGSVQVRADNVTIRNSRITSSASQVIRIHKDSGGNTYRNFVIEDSRIRGVGECSSTIAYSNYTARRVHISGCADGIKTFSNSTIEDSYIAGLYRVNGVTHNDAIQSSGGSNIVIRGNSILGPYRNSTSAILIQADQSNISNVVIEGNYLSGGGYTLYTRQKAGTTATGIRVTNNTFEAGSAAFGETSNNAAGATYSGNVTYDPTR